MSKVNVRPLRAGIISPMVDRDLLRNASRFVFESLEARFLLSAADASIRPIADIGAGDDLIVVDDPIAVDDPIVIDDGGAWQPDPSVVITSTGSYLASKTATIDATVSTFTSTLPDGSFTAIVDWGDGESGPASVVEREDGSFAVVGSHDYTSGGIFGISIEVDAIDGTVGYDYRTALPSAGDLTFIGEPWVGADLGDATAGVIGTFFDTSPTDSSDYIVTVNWGDGSTSAGAVQPSWDGTAYDVVAGHGYATKGDFTISITVTKAGNPAATLTATGAGYVYDSSSWEVDPIDLSSDRGPITTPDDTEEPPTAPGPVDAQPTNASPTLDLPAPSDPDVIFQTLGGTPAGPAEVPDVVPLGGPAAGTLSFFQPAGPSVWSSVFHSDDKIKELDTELPSVLV